MPQQGCKQRHSSKSQQRIWNTLNKQHGKTNPADYAYFSATCCISVGLMYLPYEPKYESDPMVMQYYSYQTLSKTIWQEVLVPSEIIFVIPNGWLE